LLSVEDWAEIRRLHKAERMPIKVTPRVVGCSKNTVKRALARTSAISAHAAICAGSAQRSEDTGGDERTKHCSRRNLRPGVAVELDT
jgi:hypothetical protein